MEFKLILKKINNTLTEEESKIFFAWYNESHEHVAYFNKVKQNYLKGIDEVNLTIGWKKVSSKTNKKHKRRRYLKYAVSVAILLSAGFMWFLNSKKYEEQSPKKSTVVTNKKIEIGSDRATLTLEDGSHIALGKGASYESDKALSNGEKLVYKDGSETAADAIAQNILTIPRGGQFFVVLSDGTKAWINSETQLKYPVSFRTNQTREVELVYGEAYFEVSPSTAHNGSHFVVHSGSQKVDVVGTEFNIKAYKEEESLSTTLVEGSIVIEVGGDVKKLTPGQQSKLNRTTNGLTIFEVDVDDEISWKNGLFSFKKKPLKDIMTVLSRWYDVEVVFENSAMEELTFNGVFRKSLHLDEILNILRNANEINFEINGKTILMK